MKFDAMLPHIMPSLGGCPEDVALRWLRAAAREFYDRSCAWQESLPEITTTAGETNYPLALADGAALAKLMAVNVDGEPVDVLTTFKKGQQMMRDQDEQSAAWVIEQRDLGLWVPNMTSDLPIAVEAAMHPALTATEIPDVYAEHHLEGLCAGALAKLLAMPRVPWQSMDDAAVQNTIFNNEISKAGGYAGTGHTQGRLRVKPA